MAERVGLARNISEEYLNAVADCRLANKSLIETKDILNELVGTHIHAQTNIRKTRTILLNIWFQNDPWFQDACMVIAREISVSERLPLHWALLMVAYPVFFDTCAIIGTLLDYRDEVTATQIKERIFEAWGARTTLLHAITKNLQTMKDMRVLKPQAKNGTYKPECHTVDNRKIVCVLAAAILNCSGQEYMTWEEIIHHPALFPFDIEHVTQADLAACERFHLERMGDDMVIRIK